MSRILVHTPKLARRRPVRARRVVQHVPVEYSPERPAPRWLVIGTGVLGLLVLALFVVGLVVIA
ncbi:hypothetical protein ACWGR3_28790 [Streptomyces albidoflavus]